MVGYISSKDETGLGKYELDAAEKRLILTVATLRLKKVRIPGRLLLYQIKTN